MLDIFRQTVINGEGKQLLATFITLYMAVGGGHYYRPTSRWKTKAQRSGSVLSIDTDLNSRGAGIETQALLTPAVSMTRTSTTVPSVGPKNKPSPPPHCLSKLFSGPSGAVGP